MKTFILAQKIYIFVYSYEKKNLQLINLLKIKVYKHISYLNFDILELKKKF
jgi:hypothetical protein